MNARFFKGCWVWVVSLWLVHGVSHAQDFARILQLKKEARMVDANQLPAVLNQIAFEYRNSYPDSTVYFGQQALAMAQKSGNRGQAAEALNFIGLAYAYKGDARQAFQHYQQAFDLASAQGDSTQLAFSYNNLGRLYFESANLTKAYENFGRAQVLFDHLGNREGLAYVYRSLSDLFQSQHDYENARIMSEKALALRQQMHDERGTISALSQLGKIYQLTKDYTEAEQTLREAEVIAGNQEDEASLAEIKLGLGELYFANGSYAKAMSEAFRAHSMIQKLGSPLLFSRANLLLGQIFMKEKNYPEALPFLTEAATRAESLGQLQTLTEAHFYLAQWYGLQGRPKEASLYESKYKVLNDSLKNSELAAQAERFNFQMEIEKGTRENDLLRAQEAESLAIIKFQRLLNFGALLIVVVVSVFSYFLWRSARIRKRINARLAIQNKQLNDLNHEKDSLMGIVAHDLKTPLSNIQSITELVGSLGQLNARQQEFVGLIKSSSSEGLTLINELLAVHKLETMQLPDRKEIDMTTFIEQRVSFFQTMADAKSIRLMNHAEGSTVLLTDPDWLARCLDNLISNAIKFSHKESEVVISSGLNQESFWISVKDNGPGFSDEDKQSLFQKFKRLSAKPTAGESSSGLGLNIVKMLIERMGGAITLLSEKGKGSEFIIRLPLQMPA